MEYMEPVFQWVRVVIDSLGIPCGPSCPTAVVSGSAALLLLLALAVAIRLLRGKRTRREAAPSSQPVPDEIEEAEEAAEEIGEEVANDEGEPAPAAPIPFEPPVPVEVAPTPREPLPERAEKPEETFLQKLKSRLAKTHDTLVGRLDRLTLRKTAIDRDVYEELEEILMSADMGVKTSYHLLAKLQEEVERKAASSLDMLKGVLREQIYAILSTDTPPIDPERAKPFVIMVVGVNGVGKTTTIGKLAARLGAGGSRKVMLVAADTFRAAAIEQLEFWSTKVGADFVAQKPGSDPSAVAYDALHAARSRGTDVVIVDTAGRLHTKTNLMEELKKVKRIIAREVPGAPHEILLVLDATTGQNAIMQARTFHEALQVTGVVLTKLDGTAKGGVIVGISNELNLPVRYIGIGEGVEDLTEFDPTTFLEALF